MRSCSTLLMSWSIWCRRIRLLNLFWYNSPTPNFNGGVNVMFWVIFILIFVGLALQDSGARMSRRALAGRCWRSTHSGKSQRGRGANAWTNWVPYCCSAPYYFPAVFLTVYPAGYLYCCRLCVLFSAWVYLIKRPHGRPLSSTHIMLLIIYPMTAEQ